MSTLCKIAAVSSLLMVTAPALAASDYLLQLDGVKGESKAAATQTIELESFSWGTSNAGTAAAGTGAGTGKVSMQDMSVAQVRTPRDASSGMASGKRSASPAPADGQTAAAPPKVGDVATFTVLIRESPTKSSTGKSGGCVQGTHFPSAVVVARGQRYEFADLVETSCTVVNGQTKKEFKGHVTLLK